MPPRPFPYFYVPAHMDVAAHTGALPSLQPHSLGPCPSPPGMKLGCLLARKGCVEKMQYYWDVGFYLGAQILANDLAQVVLAAEQLYKLDAPIW